MCKCNRFRESTRSRRRRFNENRSFGNRVMVDDGPGGFWGDMSAFRRNSIDSANRLGMEVVKFHGKTDHMNDISSTIYPNGSGQYPVSWFPSGVDGDGAEAYNYRNIERTPYYDKWRRHVKRLSGTYGDDMKFFTERSRRRRR